MESYFRLVLDLLKGINLIVKYPVINKPRAISVNSPRCIAKFFHHLKSLQAEVEQTKAVKHCQSKNNTVALLDQHFEKF